MFSLICGRASATVLFLGLVGAQTLYHVSQSGQFTTEVISQTFSISAVGVGADGGTTYVEDVTESYIAIDYSDTTVTVRSTAYPYTLTFVADASGYRINEPMDDGTLIETCGFGADGHGTCVEQLPDANTDTITRSGLAVPYYTLPAAITPAPTAPSVSPNHAARALPAAFMVVFSVVALFLNVL
ncbi:hypothetical protein B0H17DRAFT_1196812 [Mycena rosella]|uniref:Uncharacterized protein n=1 Tax=Mycena rosella TaxID=1033263 RepID=A0AAD7GK41_MYCRO|nr:hypothetical protein B0H17DRAFT_1196812 [Mycena rosella]